MSHMGTPNYPPTFPTTSNLTPRHLQSPLQSPHHFQFHIWAPPITHAISPPLPICLLGTFNHPPTFSSLQFSHLGTSHYPHNLTTTPNVTRRHIQLPTHFSHHSKFHTWAPPITSPLSPSLPGNLPLATKCHHHSHVTPGHMQLPTHIPPNFTTTPNFAPSHIQLPTHFPHHSQFHTWAPLIPPNFTDHFQCPT